MSGTAKPAAPYGASPIFDEISLPDKLRNEHSTKDGTWGLLRVLEGEVELDGPVKMQVEFYRENPLPEENSTD